MNYSFSPWRLITLLAPDFLGNPARGTFYGYGNYWEDAVYIGVLPLLLALGAAGGAVAAGAIRARRRGSQPDGDDRADGGLPLFLTAVVIVVLILSLGQNTPVFPFFYRYIPTFNLFQAPTRLNLLAVFALALLAGLGADRWRPPAGWTLYWTRLGAMGAATLFGGGVIGVLAVTPQTEAARQVETLARGLALGGGWLLAALLLSLFQHRLSSRMRVAAIGLFVALDLIVASYGLNPGADPALLRDAPATAPALSTAVGQHRLLYLPADEQTVKFDRLLSFEQFGSPELAAATRAAMLPNTSLLDWLATANNFEPLVSARYDQFMRVVSETESLALLQLMDVAVVASAGPRAGWEAVAQAPAAGVTFYCVPAEPRRWWVVTEARVLPDLDSALAALRDPAFDPAREVLLEAGDAGAGGGASLTLTQDAITMPVALDQPGWLVVAETHYPGWQAWVDGQPAPVLRANAAFRAVPVPAGAHVVSFAYQPRSFQFGWWLTAGAGLAWLAAGGWIALKSMSPKPHSGPHPGPGASSASSLSPVVVVLPTYNELDNLRQLAPQLLALRPDLSLIVVDDASPDGTGALADELSLAHPGRMTVIHRAGKLGLGTAYVAGFKHALAGPAGSILTMDADFSHQPRHIDSMADRLSGADLVIGSRYVPGGEVVDSPGARRMLSQTANTIAHVALGLHARDVTAGFRLYRREVLETLPLDRIFSSGYSFLIEMLYMVERRGWRVAEVPIQFKDRTMGQSKISRAEIGRALYTVARLAFRRVRGR